MNLFTKKEKIAPSCDIPMIDRGLPATKCHSVSVMCEHNKRQAMKIFRNSTPEINGMVV